MEQEALHVILLLWSDDGANGVLHDREGEGEAWHASGRSNESHNTTDTAQGHVPDPNPETSTNALDCAQCARDRGRW